MTQVRVVVVDDHMVFREGLRALLGRVEDIDIVGEAASTQEAVEVTEAVRPDVVLMDLNLPGHGGEVATRTILAAHPEIAVLVLTMHSDDAHLRHALNDGARGYLLKDAEPDAIIRAIVAVREGQAIFDPGIAPRVIAATGASQAQRPFPVLTEREYEILDRLARGLRNDAISARDGHQHQDSAEQRVDDPAQVRRHRPCPGRCPRPRRGNGPAPLTCSASATRFDLGFPSNFPMRCESCLVPPGNRPSDREVTRPIKGDSFSAAGDTDVHSSPRHPSSPQR